MRKAFFIVVLSLVVAVACCPCRKAGATTIVDKVERDSIYINHYDTLRIVERDTMRLERIEQSHDRVMVKASHSYLENAYCTSSADVSEDGILTHTLDTRDSAMLPVRTIYRERVVRDTLARDKSNKDTSVDVEVQERVVREMTWWGKTQIIALWVLLAILAIRYRKEIFALVKKIILRF